MPATVRITTVTPKMAERWLDQNTHNRPLRPDRVVWLARMIQDAEWELTGDALVFDVDDILLNGQHRLAAIIAADKPARMLVLRGIRRQAQDVMDAGAVRKLGDQLKLRGETNVNTLASALLWLVRLDIIERTGEGVTGMSAEMRPTNRQCFAVLDENPDIRESLKHIQGVRKVLHLFSGPTTALHYRMSLLSIVDCDKFWEKLQTGVELRASDPIFKARQQFLLNASATAGQRMRDWRQAAILGKAWNLWRQGEPVNTKGIQWRWGATHREDFPIPR